MALTLRQMAPADIDLGMRLKGQAGWNQTREDWQRFLDLEPEGCFVAVWEGQPVATTTTCTFGPVGWIAMVLVDEAFRHRGIATQLVQRALEYLHEQSVKTVRLDATKYGRPVYERIGFVAEHDLIRFQGIARSMPESPDTLPVRPEDLGLLQKLDRLATGTDRARLLERLASGCQDSSRITMDGHTATGYVFLRPGSTATHIGPAAAMAEHAGRLLGNWALNRCEGQPVFVDVPVENYRAVEWARAAGLEEQRRFTRMVLGRSVDEDVEVLWASSGPEKG